MAESTNKTSQNKLEFRFNLEKTVQALNFFCIENGGTINRLKAMKMLFLADKTHLNKYGRNISGDAYVAMEMGPVLSNTWNLLRPEKKKALVIKDWYSYLAKYLEFESIVMLRSKQHIDDGEFSNSDIICLKATADSFLRIPQNQLIKILHTFPEWEKVWHSKAHYREKVLPITIESMFFSGASAEKPYLVKRARLIADAQAA